MIVYQIKKKDNSTTSMAMKHQNNIISTIETSTMMKIFKLTIYLGRFLVMKIHSLDFKVVDLEIFFLTHLMFTTLIQGDKMAFSDSDPSETPKETTIINKFIKLNKDGLHYFRFYLFL